MIKINANRFAAAKGVAFKGETVHASRAKTATEPKAIRDELASDRRARELYNEFAQIGHTFIEKSGTTDDLNSQPSRVVLSETGHDVSFKMASQAHIGLAGLAMGVLRGFDRVATGPAVTGAAVLENEAGSNSTDFTQEVDSFQAETTTVHHIGLGMGSARYKSRRNYVMSRDESGTPVMNRTTRNALGKVTNNETISFNKDGNLVYLVE